MLSRAIVGDRFGHGESARYMAYIGMAAGLTPALSPMVGGLVQVSVGWRAVFHTMTGLGLVALGRRGEPLRFAERGMLWLIAFAVALFVVDEALAERPMLVHQRHAD